MRRPLLVLALLLVPVATAAPSALFPLSVEIVGYDVDRRPGEVRVWVDVQGTSTVGRLGGVVGEVKVVAPTPCWPDPGLDCGTVLDEQVRTFVASGLFSLTGTWFAHVGPFTYSAHVGPACNVLDVTATVRDGTSTAAAWDRPELCG